MNARIIENYNQLIDSLYITKPANYSFKINSFKKTIDIIQNLDFDIKTSEQLKDIKGIGKGTLTRIQEIITDGSLKDNSISKSESQPSASESNQASPLLLGSSP